MQSVCGSFTNLLKLRVSTKKGGTGSDSSSQTSEADCALQTGEGHENSESGLYYSHVEIILCFLPSQIK
jgi:hypothetical protein